MKANNIIKEITLNTDRLLTVYAFLNILILAAYRSLLTWGPFPHANYYYNLIVTGLLIINLIGNFIVKKHEFEISAKLIDIAIITVGLILMKDPVFFQLCIVFRQGYYFIGSIVKKNETIGAIWKDKSDSPAFILLFGFLATILVGTFLLILPISTVPGRMTTFIGALFTATSATCVTGLIVYDTGSHFSSFGQLIILLLFQIGGLGIMTISTSFAVLTGQKLSRSGENVISSITNEDNIHSIIRLVKSIIAVTFTLELIGAAYLFTVFSDRFNSLSEQAFAAIFHSVSAFCNAGFSTFSNSFMDYKGHIGLNLTIMFLIVTGGIGFSVISDVRANVIGKFRPHRFSIHSKVVLLCTLFLVLFGALFFYLAEYNYTMRQFSLQERALSSLFQSVTARTAGFNTVTTSQYSQSSSFLTIIFMFIGASPGSTGGGIKTTSFVIIILSVLALLTNNRDVVVFDRKIPEQLIKRIMALIAVSLSLLFSCIILLMLIEPFSFEHIIFEAVSAFGTVGLSLGITPDLSEAGRIVVVILMYFGRVGPLTLIFALSRKTPQSSSIYEEGKIAVG